MTAWLHRPVALARIAWLRTLLYLFVPLDVLVTTPWVAAHDTAPASLYAPLFVGRVLQHPAPTTLLVDVVQVLLLVAALVAATGRAPRLLGSAVAVLYFEWMLIAMSYGKVDHDRFAFLVALAVLPTIGKIRWRDNSSDANAAWAIRAIQLAVVATYFLSTFAKFRFGGLDWVNGATLMRAVLRRGTDLAEPLTTVPWVLHVGQYLIVIFELASPLMLVRGRIGRFMLASAVLFHTVTFLAIRIAFWPHLLCLLAFLPLERLEQRVRLSRARNTAETPV